MKKYFVMSMMMVFSAIVAAQTDSIKNNQQPVQSTGKTIPVFQTNGVVLKDGKPMLIKEGKMTAMNSDFTCDDGTTVARNGTIHKKSGASKALKEGEYVDKSGEVMIIKSEVEKKTTEKPTKKKKSFFKHLEM